jgi:hypothetical protein
MALIVAPESSETSKSCPSIVIFIGVPFALGDIVLERIH